MKICVDIPFEYKLNKKYFFDTICSETCFQEIQGDLENLPCIPEPVFKALLIEIVREEKVKHIKGYPYKNKEVLKNVIFDRVIRAEYISLNDFILKKQEITIFYDFLGFHFSQRYKFSKTNNDMDVKNQEKAYMCIYSKFFENFYFYEGQIYLNKYFDESEIKKVLHKYKMFTDYYDKYYVSKHKEYWKPHEVTDKKLIKLKEILFEFKDILEKIYHNSNIIEVEKLIEQKKDFVDFKIEKELLKMFDDKYNQFLDLKS